MIDVEVAHGFAALERELRADGLINDCHTDQRRLADSLVPGAAVATMWSRRQGKTEGVLRAIVTQCRTIEGARFAWVREMPQYAFRTVGFLLAKLKRAYGIDYRPNSQTYTFRIGEGEIQCYGIFHPKFSGSIQGNYYHGVVLDELQDMWAANIAANIDADIGPTLTDYDGWVAAVFTPGDYCAGLAYRIAKRAGIVESGTEVEAPDDVRQREEVLAATFDVIRGEPFSNPATAPGQQKKLAEYRKHDPDIDARPWVLREYYNRWVADSSRAVVRFGRNAYIIDWKPHGNDTYLIGLDYGFDPDPCALVVGVYNAETMPYLLLLEAEERARMTEEDVLSWVLSYVVRYPGVTVHFDYAGGGTRSAEHLREAGIPVMFADKTEDARITTRRMDSDARLGRIKVYNVQAPDDPENHPMVRYWQASRWELGKAGYEVAKPKHLHDAARYLYRRSQHHDYVPPTIKPIEQQIAERLDAQDIADRETHARWGIR